MLDPTMGGGGEQLPVMAEETVLQKVWRFILGLLGLDSAPSTNAGSEGTQTYNEPVPAPAGPGG